MAKKQEKEVKKTTDPKAEIRAQVKKLREELFEIKMEAMQMKLKNTSLITAKRKEIARLLTTLRRAELEAMHENA